MASATASPRAPSSDATILVNAMTVDVEDYFHVSAFAGHIDRAQWEDFDCRVARNTERLLQLFADRGVRATFFVLGWVAQRYPGVVRDIAAHGHEIACHGLTHELVYEQRRDDFHRQTKLAKDVIEDITGVPVLGYRAASYSIVHKSLWALDVLAELGFIYDSSIFPVRHDRYGIPGAEREPNTIRTPAGHTLVEFPLSTLRLGPLRVPVAGGGYFRLFPYWFTRFALGRINSVDRLPFVFYLHPWEVDPDQPRVHASPLSRFRHYTNLRRCEARLAQLVQDFQFGTMRDVLTQQHLLPAADSTATAPTVGGGRMAVAR